MLRAAIVTEGGGESGTGHLRRCVALAEALVEQGCESFFVANDDSIPREILSGREAHFFEWRTDAERLSPLLHGVSIAVIDSYHASEGFYARVAAQVPVTAAIDDYCRLPYPVPIVINGALYAPLLPFAKGSMLWLGPDYALMRRAFWKQPEKVIQSHVSTILITFGGSDVRHVAPQVVDCIQQISPRWRKKVVLGCALEEVDQMRAVADGSTELLTQLSAEEMRNLMVEADIAVSAGGQTLHELACIGVPTVTVAVADNQLLNVQAFARTQMMDYAGWWQHSQTLVEILRQLDRLENLELREARHRALRSRFDGQGACRVAQKLLRAC